MKKNIIKRDDNITSVEEYVKRNLGNCNEDVDIQGYEYPNMRKAVDMFLYALRNGKKIVVYGDYDADGICSLTEFVIASRVLQHQIDVIAPDRFGDGYGLTVDRAKSFIGKYDLLITVDNGITAVDAIKVARDGGLRVVVLDHHEQSGELPNANIIVDPHVTGGDKDTGFEDLCGAGLTLRFLEKVLREIKSLRPERFTSTLNQLYAVAAIGTIADVVTLRHDNRAIVKIGLKCLNEGLAPAGVKAFLEKVLNGKEVDTESIGFSIAPCINAAGRLKENGASLILDIFTTPNVFLGGTYAKIDEAIELNEQRKTIVKDEVDRAVGLLQVRKTDKIVIYINKLGMPGIMGLVAGKLAEKFKRPALALCGDEELKGSGRTYGNADIFAALSEAKEYMISFGGHPEACGLSFKRADVESVRKILNENLPEVVNEDEVYYDLELTDPITEYNELQQYAPFGCGNPAPKFYVMAKVDSLFKMGKNKEHLSITITVNEQQLKVMSFFHEGKAPWPGKVIEVVGDLSKEVYNGKETPKLIADVII